MAANKHRTSATKSHTFLRIAELVLGKLYRGSPVFIQQGVAFVLVSKMRHAACVDAAKMRSEQHFSEPVGMMTSRRDLRMI
jgi:hypothetical protein